MFRLTNASLRDTSRSAETGSYELNWYHNSAEIRWVSHYYLALHKFNKMLAYIPRKSGNYYKYLSDCILNFETLRHSLRQYSHRCNVKKKKFNFTETKVCRVIDRFLRHAKNCRVDTDIFRKARNMLFMRKRPRETVAPDLILIRRDWYSEGTRSIILPLSSRVQKGEFRPRISSFRAIRFESSQRAITASRQSRKTHI